MTVDPFGLSPDEAVQWFREKGYALTFSWKDMWAEQHARAFTVAKATQLDVLADIRVAVDDAISRGVSTQEFTKLLRPTLEAKGWWGEKEVDGPDGKQIVQLGSARRLKTIYETNLRQAHAAARWERIERTAETRPYLRYVALLDGRERPEHKRWHGTILPWDHPWWKTHAPPNGWGCRCKIQQLSDRDLERYGLKVSQRAPPVKMVEFQRGKQTIQVPAGIDPSFDYNPGLARRGWTPPDNAPVLHPVQTFKTQGRPPSSQLAPRAPAAPTWSAESPARVREQWREHFGGDEGVVKDPGGGEVAFTMRYLDHLLEKGEKRRVEAVPHAIQAVTSPAEIWMVPVRNEKTGVVTMRKRYIGLFEGASHVTIGDLQPDGYIAWTSYPRKDLDAKREGYLLYAADAQ